MKKYISDLNVVSVRKLNDRYFKMKLGSEMTLPEMLPGQFVEVRVDHSPTTMLRRPISIHDVDRESNLLSLLVASVGAGTRQLSLLHEGDKLNLVFPLGNGFTMPSSSDEKLLLVGGGVGIAPLLYFGKQIKGMGATPTFLLGARTASDLVELDAYRSLGPVYITTEDGSMGEKGFVTQHSVLKQSCEEGRASSAERDSINGSDKCFDRISTCGPKPMMVAVARYAAQHAIDCEASLENLMACGLGACLCCVEKTTDGNLCVCKEGPVFNTKRLLWQI